MINAIVVENKKLEVCVNSIFPIMPSFQNFSILATTNGQVQFVLPAYPMLTGLMTVNINGAMQDPLAGDYTVNGNILTLNANLIIGDKVAGFFQSTPQNVNPSVLNYRTFFIVATQGQTSFPIGFVPQALIYIAVNGVIESTMDYTINGQTITLSSGLNAGDNFFGLAIQ